jgi:hypothetical protein
MEKQKRQKTGGGSRKGIPNKNTAELKDMILNALGKAGGENYLYKQAFENPSAFMTLISKVLPRDINQTTTHKGEINLKSMSDDDLSYAVSKLSEQYSAIRQSLN